MLEIEDRLVLVAARVLDRAADEPGFACEPDGFGRGAGRVAEAFLEVGRDREIGGDYDGARVGKSLVAGHGAVAPTERSGAGTARGRERREAERREDASRARVPGVGDEEGPRTLVEASEPERLVGHCGGHGKSYRALRRWRSSIQRTVM